MSVLSRGFKLYRGVKYSPVVDGIGGLRMEQNEDMSTPSHKLYVRSDDFEYAIAEVIALRKHLSYLSSIFNQDISEKIDADINERLITLKGE